MINTSFASTCAGVCAPVARASGSSPAPIDGYAGSIGEESISPQIAYAETAAPGTGNPVKMDAGTITLLAGGVGAVLVFTLCCNATGGPGPEGNTTRDP